MWDTLSVSSLVAVTSSRPERGLKLACARESQIFLKAIQCETPKYQGFMAEGIA
jgi:hypothetical protein